MTHTSYKIKCCLVFEIACLTLLCGCVRQNDAVPAWEKMFENSGAVVRLSNCNATETQSLFWPDLEDDPIELLTVEADNVPVMSVQGTSPENLELSFADLYEGGTALYTKVKPVLNLDYRQTQTEEGTVQYKLETVYSYYVVVKTELGTDQFLIKCTRQV